MRTARISIKAVNDMENYNDFLIEDNGYNKVNVYNLNGQLLRTCREVKEAKERIDSQTI